MDVLVGEESVSDDGLGYEVVKRIHSCAYFREVLKGNNNIIKGLLTGHFIVCFSVNILHIYVLN